MKPKKLQKILKKFQRLPSHVMDTNILVEALKDTRLGDTCSSYLNRIGYKYRGVLCASVLGEFLLHALKDIEEPEERKFMLDFIDKISKKAKCGYSSLIALQGNNLDTLLPCELYVNPQTCPDSFVGSL